MLHLVALLGLLQDPAAAAQVHGGALPEFHGPCVSPEDRKRIAAQIEDYQRRYGPLSSRRSAPPPYTFYPQGGNLWRDLFTQNFVDLDATSPGILDWNCSDRTYDYHDASDTILRGFDEQDLGVPIFAAQDGTVIAAHDGEFDKNTAALGQPANYVAVDHGNGRIAYYYHMRRNSVAVSVGQPVRAGQTLGYTGSSGNSTYPHLHFATYDNGVVLEPWAGGCRPGASGWEDQVPIEQSSYLIDGAFAYENPLINGGLPWPLPRTGQIGLADQYTYLWLVFANLPPNSTWRYQLRRPDGTVSYDSGTVSFGNATEYYWSWFYWQIDWPDLHTITGTWHWVFSLNGALTLNAPFEVVTQRSPSFNRPPNPIAVALEPQDAQPDQGIACRIDTDQVLDDPDYEVLRYQYVWFRNGQVVRNVTHAGHADVLPAGTAQAGDSVQCTVAASDGRASSAPAQDAILVGGSGLKLLAPQPGLAAQANALVVQGATANAPVSFAYSLQAGSTPVGACPGLLTELHAPILLGQDRASGAGVATWTINVPAAAAGVTAYFQAGELGTCRKTNLVRYQFR